MSSRNLKKEENQETRVREGEGFNERVKEEKEKGSRRGKKERKKKGKQNEISRSVLKDEKEEPEER